MSSDPTNEHQPETFKQDDAATFNTERKEAEHDSMGSEHEPTKEDEQTDKQADPLEMVENRWARIKHFWEFITKQEHANAIMAIFTVLIFVSGAVYSVFALLQWLAMRESNRINRESLESVQRAFVTFQGIQGTVEIRLKTSGEESDFLFFSSFMNTGTTNANGIARYFHGDELLLEPTEKQFRGDSVSPGGVIGPKAPYSIGGVTKPESFFFGTEFKNVRSLQSLLVNRKFFLWGWIAYRDVFPKTELHVTEFCQMLDRIGANPSASPSARPEWFFHFINCDHHNCADETCDDYQAIVALSLK